MKIVKKYEYLKIERCQRCGRRLKTEESKTIGFGPSCYKKHIKEGGEYKNIKGGDCFNG